MRQQLHRLGAALAVFVAGIHLYWALPVAARQLRYMQIHDPRPAAFLLAAMGILAGIALVYQGFNPLPIYLGGIGLMLVFLFGYAGWHTVLDHGAFWPGRPGHGHSHGATFGVVIDHLRDDPVALASKIGELALLVVLGALAIDRRRDETA